MPPCESSLKLWEKLPSASSYSTIFQNPSLWCSIFVFIHFPSWKVTSTANSSTYLNFFFNIKSLSVVMAEIPTNKSFQSLLTQPLLQFKFSNDFQASLYVKKSDYSLMDWELLTSQLVIGEFIIMCRYKNNLNLKCRISIVNLKKTITTRKESHSSY